MMAIRPLLVPCLLLATASVGARAEPRTYAIDPVHTRVVFAIDHAGFSKALGAVSGSTGTLHFNPDDWGSARVEVEVPLARLDLGDADWNRAALARNLLDVAGHPVARFVSTRIEPVDATRAIVHGRLALHGVEREVALEVVLNAAKRYPLPPFRRTVGFSASTAISRADFGITAWKSVIGDRVELRIEAEAARSRVAGDSDSDAADPGDSTTRDAATPDTSAEAAPTPSSAPAQQDTQP